MLGLPEQRRSLAAGRGGQARPWGQLMAVSGGWAQCQGTLRAFPEGVPPVWCFVLTSCGLSLSLCCLHKCQVSGQGG